ncbi:MAG TPA: L-glyceraldehyde 3-phosphate reductase [Streptosporangiaceae bacterium]|nr:L-glyceraldehyde 3-phosphate reductase [Streptosporangiaceae bacterium]
MTYVAAPDRYEQIPYRRCGQSGIDMPAISLGLWQNFGDATPFATQRVIVRRAFDLGVTHFDLANNYGGTAPAESFGTYDYGEPYGSAETNFGRILREDLRPYRDELLISTKAGWDMWPGPYGDLGSRKYLLASLDQSLRRMGLEYVDIFYSHRPDPATPLEETMSALATAVQSGRALYAGISSYPPEQTAQAAAMLRQMGVRLLIHQPSYSLFDRWVQDGLLAALERDGIGCIAFSPLAQGLLTSRYLNGIPEGSRASRAGSLSPDLLTEKTVSHLRALNDIAQARGQTLAQLALAWVLRDQRVTSALVGASSVAQLEENLRAVDGPPFTAEELAAIDAHSVHAGIAVD